MHTSHTALTAFQFTTLIKLVSGRSSAGSSWSEMAINDDTLWEMFPLYNYLNECCRLHSVAILPWSEITAIFLQSHFLCVLLVCCATKKFRVTLTLPLTNPKSCLDPSTNLHSKHVVLKCVHQMKTHFPVEERMFIHQHLLRKLKWQHAWVSLIDSDP